MKTDSWARSTGALLLLSGLCGCGPNSEGSAMTGAAGSGATQSGSGGATGVGGALGVAAGGGLPAAVSGGASGEGTSSAMGGGPGATMPLPVPAFECAAYVSGNAFSVCVASYLAGPVDDGLTSIDFSPSGEVVAGGSIAGDNLGVAPVVLEGGTNGAVVRLSANGRTVLSLSRIGTGVTDLHVLNNGGNIAVGGDFGLALLTPLADAVLWRHPVGPVKKVAVAADGSVAVLVQKTVSVFSAAGDSLGSFDVNTTTVNDVAIDSATRSVFVVGFKQDNGAPCTELQIPFMRSYSYQGVLRWKGYDWTRSEAGGVNECADSRGVAVAMGRDGMLYYAGESHGGNTVHRRLPQQISMMAPVTKFDKFNDPYNLNGAAPITFYGRFSPVDGSIVVGQYLVTRLSSDKGNAARPNAIAANEKGQVLVTGSTACCVEGADSRTVNGVPAFGNYAGGGFALVVSSDFSARLGWTSFNGEVGEGAVGVAAAAGGGRMAAVMLHSLNSQSTTTRPLLTFDAIQSAPPGGQSDGFFAVWQSP